MTHIDRPLLIHVAAESEGRGRVVLAAQTATPHEAALGAALKVAAAFETWVECQLVESPDVAALTEHSFARGVSRHGRITPLNASDLSGWQAAATAAARAAVTSAALASGIRLETHITRDTLADALAKACAIEGPWNIIVLADAVASTEVATLLTLLNTVSGATGIVCVGPVAAATTDARGPIVVVVEEMERLSQMLRVAETLAKVRPSEPRAVHLVVAAAGPELKAELDGHLRLLLADVQHDPASPVTIADSTIAYGTEDEIAEAVRKLDGGFVIARFGGLAVPASGTSSSLIGVTRCPMLLVR